MAIFRDVLRVDDGASQLKGQAQNPDAPITINQKNHQVIFLLCLWLCRAVFPVSAVSPYWLASLLICIYNFCVEVFEKTISRTEMIDHSFES